MDNFKWKRPKLEQGNPGFGEAATQLFHGKRQMPLDTFVREDLQNRVDAKCDAVDGPVRVKIHFQTLPANVIAKYFPTDFQEFFRRTECQSLHGDDKTRRLAQIDKIFSSKEFPVLVIEDFYSTGLSGPINSQIPENDPENPLYHPTNALTCFFRRNGQSGKTDKKLGSAGLGRHVYYKASEISSKLIYTVPSDLSKEHDNALVPIDPVPLFFGQSFQHELAERIDSQQRRFCAYHNLSRGTDKDLPMPFGIDCSEADLVEQMRVDFRLLRKPEEPGCSIVIPFPKKNFTNDKLINSIVRDFPMPVLSRMLEVEVGDLLIDSNTIAALSDNVEVNQHTCFLRDALSTNPAVIADVDYERLQKPFAEDLIDEMTLKNLAITYNDNGLVCIRVNLRFGDRGDQVGSIIVAVQQSGEGQKGRQLVARTGLVLSDYSDKNFISRSNAAVMVQPDSLGSLLRSVENPAHSEWLAGDIDPHRCQIPDELIRFVKNAHKDLARILTNLDTQDDFSIFRDLVPAGRRKPGPAEEPPFEMGLDETGQIIVVRPAEKYGSKAGTVWRLTIVYDSIQGSGRARKGYRPGTYNLEKVSVDITGGKLVKRGACHLDTKVATPKSFSLQIGPCGFAQWADVRIHAQRLSS